jgi:hypothetical protein
MISPTDIRWWIMSCQRSIKCPTRTTAQCVGCLGNGFTVDLLGIRKLTSLRRDEFCQTLIRGPNAKFPWDNDYVFEAEDS